MCGLSVYVMCWYCENEYKFQSRVAVFITFCCNMFKSFNFYFCGNFLLWMRNFPEKYSGRVIYYKFIHTSKFEFSQFTIQFPAQSRIPNHIIANILQWWWCIYWMCMNYNFLTRMPFNFRLFPFFCCFFLFHLVHNKL